MTWRPGSLFTFWPYLQRPWLIVTFFALVIVALLPGVRGVVRSVFSGLRQFAHVRGAAPVAIGVLSVLAGAVPTWIGRVGLPRVPDEFSYLLAADTFASGRLTNPAHEYWRHFQSTHILAHPTYMSKYPPGQGIALAIGMMLGSARLGAYGTVALGCVATWWAFRGCLSRTWALTGALLTAVNPYVFTWGQNYWGGGVGMLGGALVLGGALRAMRRPHWKHGLVMGCGFAIVLNSRQFEAVLIAALLGGCMLLDAWLRQRKRKPKPRRSSWQSRWRGTWSAWRARREVVLIRQVGLVTAAVLTPVVIWMLYYNYRVSGHALVTPYQEHARQYTKAPLFFFQRVNEAASQVDVPHLRAFHTIYEFSEYKDQSTWSGFVAGAFRKLNFITLNAFIPLATLIALLAGGWWAVGRHRAGRIAVFLCPAILLIHIASTPWLRTQYLSPIAPIYLALVTLSVRELARWGKWFRSVNFLRDCALPRAAAIGLFAATAGSAVAFVRDETPFMQSQTTVREEMSDMISRRVDGDHLVFVAYASGPQQPYEWVHNSANIDAQRVVFAHVLDTGSNAGLREYYRDRSVWLLMVNDTAYELNAVHLQHPPRPDPVSPATQPAAAMPPVPSR